MSINDDQRSLRERVSEFVAHEADLADARAYDEWLKLWSPDCCLLGALQSGRL